MTTTRGLVSEIRSVATCRRLRAMVATTSSVVIYRGLGGRVAPWVRAMGTWWLRSYSRFVLTASSPGSIQLVDAIRVADSIPRADAIRVRILDLTRRRRGGE